MKGRAVIDGAAFGPEALKAIGQAFDQAWAEIAEHFAGDPVITESARLTLADAILSVASESRPGCPSSEERGAPSNGPELQVIADRHNKVST
jgi:hypothetical protein